MKNKTTILIETQYWPSIQYFSKFVVFEKVLIEAKEHYVKRSYRNRCHIAGANGMMRLSIPLKKGKNEQLPISQVAIAYEENWQSHHWQSIRSAYGNAPFFDFYADEMEALYKEQPLYLFDWNQKIMDFILNQLGFTPLVGCTDKYYLEVPEGILDFRNSILPKNHRLNEDHHFKPVRYSQVFIEKNGFLPNLSIIDLLFCKGPESLLILEDCYQGQIN